MLKLVPKPIRQYAKFKGRMTRSQFLRWLGILLLIYIICAWIDLAFIAPALGYLPFEEVEEQYLTTIAIILLVIPWLSSNIRRLHDVNASGWWMLFAIPMILIIYFASDIAFALYGFLTRSAGAIPPNIVEFVMNWMPWLIISMAVFCFSPAIFWMIKKGVNIPNRFGSRD